MKKHVLPLLLAMLWLGAIAQNSCPTPVNTTQSFSLSPCGNESTVLSVTGNGGTINWYNVPTGGTPLGTGNSFTTPILPNPSAPGTVNTVTYYAQETTACGTSDRLAIPLTVKYKYSYTNTTPAANMVVCPGATTTLSITTSAPTIEWGIFFGDGTVLSSTNSLTQPIQTDILYFVEAKGDPANTCAGFQVFSVRTATATNTAPTDVTPVDSITNICPGRKVVIKVASNNGGVLLYDAPTGGNAVASASSSSLNVQSLETPVIVGTTTFYAQTGIGACASPRIPITVTTRPTPTGSITWANDTIKAANLFNTYVLKKDGSVVSSGNTGSFAVPATACGTYQAEFTNTVNNCNNVGVNITRQFAPCATYLNLSSIQFPITYSYGFGSFADPPATILNQNPISIPVCTNGGLNVKIKSATGCMYEITVQTIGLNNGPINLTLSSTSDSLTSCTIFSNTVQVAPQGPTNITSAPFLNICSGGSTILTASGPGTLQWYSTPNGGAVLGTGTTFTTPAITANTTYYVESVNGNCTSARTAIAVTVNALPATPVNITPTANQNICSGNSTVLSVTPAGSGTSTFWSLFPQGGNTFTTGASATIAASSLTATDTFYVGNAYVSNNCNSPLIPIIVTVKQTPAAPANTSGANQTVCTGSATILSATGTGTLNWYAGPSGGASLGTGGIFTTAVINGNAVYYVDATNNSCTSARTPIILNVNQGPQAPTNTTTTANQTRCAGSTANLSASTTFAGAQLKWYADATGGAALFTGAAYTTAALTATDTFYVAAESATCASVRTAIVVTVNALPTAGISTAIPSVCPGENITLTASGGTSYAWSNSGGSNAAATFTPIAATTYTVTVTNTANCSATTSLNVTIRTAPVAAITPATSAICSGQSQTLTASGGTGYAWSNSLGNGANKTVSPAQTATYTVTVTNANACSATASITINVTTTPVAAINGPTTICAGLSATLTASGGNSYAWSNSLGSNATISVSPTQTTTYTVIASNGNCADTASQTVSVQSAPSAVINGNTTICRGQSTTLTANGGNTYTWSNGSSNNAAITVSPVSTTTYNVTVSIGANCTASATQTVTVKQPSASTLNEAICFGEAMNFAGSTLTASGAYYDTLQNAAGCDSIITLNLTIRSKEEKTVSKTICSGQVYDFNGTQLTQDGQYFDTLQTVAGCDSFIVLNLSIASQLTSNIDAAICQGESYEFNGQQLNSPDSYTATLTSTGGCDSIVTLNLTVNALPQPVVTANGNVLSTQAFDTYQWQLNGSDISNAETQQHIAAENGSYSVIVSDNNGCSNTSSALVVTGVGISSIEAITMSLYPNPVQDILIIEAAEVTGTQITITDMSGKVLIKQLLTGNKTTVDVAAIPAGILNIQLSNLQGTATTKLVKLN